jgi:hypothetical protein
LFQALCKDLERGEVKKWLKQILEILMAERGKEERTEQVQFFSKLPPYTPAGFDLATHSSSPLGGRRR